MRQYLDLCQHIIDNGTYKADRTGTGTYSIFGYQMRFKLEDGFPLLTTKKLHLKSIIYELLWFLRGDTNLHYLHEHDVHIWDEWADENGDLGPIYGFQWRHWNDDRTNTDTDQIAEIIKTIKRDPNSRRLIVSSWNVAQIDKMALPPCHVLFQFYVVDKRLSLQLYQRSADVFLGLPFNIASYALLLKMIAQVTCLHPDELIVSLGDAHIYSNHLEQIKTQLLRQPRTLPDVILNPAIRDIDDFKFEDFSLINYTPYPHIKGEVSV